MGTKHDDCYELATRIYDLDEAVYKIVGSSLGRTFTGDRDTCIEEITMLLITKPRMQECRSTIALIGNMARTIKNKEERKRMMTEYNEILQEIKKIPTTFGSLDIINENMAALNTSNLRQKFSPEDHLVICIGRNHGSAGADIGFALADKLKIDYYDAEIFQKVIERMDAEKENVEDDNSDYFDKAKRAANPHKKVSKLKKYLKNFTKYHGLPVQDAIFFNQSDLIKDMAKREDFVVMGRCADVILTNHRIPHISIFITAPFEQRAERMMKALKMDYKHVTRFLKRLDHKHEAYYKFYTGRQWGNAVNYDLCINSASYGIAETVDLIVRMIDQYPNHKKLTEE